MSESAVDVIVPCFRMGAYLEPLLENIYSACSRLHTVTIVDDCSNDRLTQIALSRLRPVGSRQELRIETLEENSGGVAKPRNRGLTHAAAEFVMFLDADDLLAEASLDRAISVMQNEGSDVGLTSWAPLREDDFSCQEAVTPKIPYSVDSRFIFLNWERSLTIPIHSAVFRKSTLRNVRFEEILKSKEDFHFWTVFFNQKRKVSLISDVAAIYRTRDSSMSQGNFTENGLWFMHSATQIVREIPYLRPLLPDIYEYVASFYGERISTVDRPAFKRELSQAWISADFLNPSQILR